MGNLIGKDIIITPLKRIDVPGGDILHAMKKDDPGYKEFGEAYFSIVEHGVVKAWKRHLSMTLNLVVPVGDVKFAVKSQRGKVEDIVIGESNYVRLTVPPKIWFGFSGLFSPYSMLLNIANIKHDPGEVERKEIDFIEYDWERKL